ncbi:uncharacterized protein LOC142518080 isoform X3 [Primulina tabacum]|uniref:uncharacterized protein LOC142518080 isoform X3 n=1 Tax=Primulina tabacum TaxID=48773 RepID=UPI003F59C20F
MEVLFVTCFCARILSGFGVHEVTRDDRVIGDRRQDVCCSCSMYLHKHALDFFRMRVLVNNSYKSSSLWVDLRNANLQAKANMKKAAQQEPSQKIKSSTQQFTNLTTYNVIFWYKFPWPLFLYSQITMVSYFQLQVSVHVIFSFYYIGLDKKRQVLWLRSRLFSVGLVAVLLLIALGSLWLFK